MSEKLPDCCKTVKNKKHNGFWWGVLYGIIPHIFCILFVVFSVVGATSGALFLRRFMVIPHFFQILMALSLFFATLTAIFYLKRNDLLTTNGIKKSWKYLTILFVTTIGINLILFYLVIPAVGNIRSNGATSQPISSTVTMENGVQIVRMTQTGRGYSPNQFTIKKNLSVKWIIMGTNTGFCSSSIVSSQLNMRMDLNVGENVFEFTPIKLGQIKFSCSMGMYTGYFNVVN